MEMGSAKNFGIRKRELISTVKSMVEAHCPQQVSCADILNSLMEPDFAAVFRLICHQGSLTSNLSFVLNDPTSFAFDNEYYGHAMGGRGMLKLDAEMVLVPQTAHVMQHFSINQDDFFQEFSSAYVKLSCSRVLTGKQGVI
ncbi:hypothetical protein REPUB_Repub15cG0008600 [Reevesia pubescens]